jgi:LacI family transcriptional regulator, galactose operon repressor
MTLKDLAKELDLSPSTISRALSRPNLVTPRTLARIRAAIEETGFRPNAVAQSLRTSKTRTVGLLVADISNWFFGLIVESVEDAARLHGYSVLVCNAKEERVREEKALELLGARKVSGVINCSTGASVDSLRAFQRRGIPVVELDRRSELTHVSTVMLDNERAGRLAARHLIHLGHTQVATIAGPSHLSNSKARLLGFMQEMTDAQISLPRHYIEIGDYRDESGYRAASKLVGLRDPPTALFVANSEMTLGALTALRERQMEVPEALSIVGFDDPLWARHLDPALTVVTQPIVEMAKTATALLLSLLQDPQAIRLEVFPPDLVIRQSTAPFGDRG